MSDTVRPAAILASVLELHRLALFVKMRSLVLAESPEEIEALERNFTVTQREAQDYFLHFHDWTEKDHQFLRDETIPRSERIAALTLALNLSRSAPLIAPIPDA